MQLIVIKKRGYEFEGNEEGCTNEFAGRKGKGEMLQLKDNL